MKIYYIYIYLDPRKPGKYEYKLFKKVLVLNYEPIYVGKGSNNRYKVHLNLSECRNGRFKVKIKHIRKAGFDNPIVKFKRNLSEKEAYCLEEELIEMIGRLDWSQGPLVNATEGGSLPPKVIITEELRKKRRETAKKLWEDPKMKLRIKKKLRDSWKNPLKRKKQSEKMKGKRIGLGHKLSESHKKIVSQSAKKRWQDPEYKKTVGKKISIGQKGNKNGRKLDEEKAFRIRKLYEFKSITHKKLAKRFNVHELTIGKVVRQEIYAEGS